MTPEQLEIEKININRRSTIRSIVVKELNPSIPNNGREFTNIIVSLGSLRVDDYILTRATSFEFCLFIIIKYNHLFPITTYLYNFLKYYTDHFLSFAVDLQLCPEPLLDILIDINFINKNISCRYQKIIRKGGFTKCYHRYYINIYLYILRNMITN